MQTKHSVLYSYIPCERCMYGGENAVVERLRKWVLYTLEHIQGLRTYAHTHMLPMSLSQYLCTLFYSSR